MRACSRAHSLGQMHGERQRVVGPGRERGDRSFGVAARDQHHAGRRVAGRQQVPEPRRIGIGHGEEDGIHRLTAGHFLHFDQEEPRPGQRTLEPLRPRPDITREEDMGTTHLVGGHAGRHRRTG